MIIPFEMKIIGEEKGFTFLKQKDERQNIDR